VISPENPALDELIVVFKGKHLALQKKCFRGLKEILV
jgi:hypothetical protein